MCLFRRCVIEETNTVLHVVLLNHLSDKKEHTTFRKLILLLSSGKSRRLKLNCILSIKLRYPVCLNRPSNYQTEQPKEQRSCHTYKLPIAVRSREWTSCTKHKFALGGSHYESSINNLCLIQFRSRGPSWVLGMLVLEVIGAFYLAVREKGTSMERYYL